MCIIHTCLFMCEMYSNYQKFHVKLNKIYPYVFLYSTVYRERGGETVLWILNFLFLISSIGNLIGQCTVPRPEAKLLDAIGTKVLRVFPVGIYSHLY